MVATPEWTRVTREQISKLDLTNPKHQMIYEQKLREFLRFNELEIKKDKTDFYFDKARRAQNIGDGKITVSTGFNMSRPEARAEWDNIFKGEIFFDEVLTGKRVLSDEEMHQQEDYSIAIRREELQKHYGAYWYKLIPNERLAIEVANWASPSLVRTYYDKVLKKRVETNFSRNMKKYIETQDPQYKENAMRELKENSNHKAPVHLKEGLQNRRNVEALMLASQDMDSCCASNLFLNRPVRTQESKVQVIIGETVIPPNPGEHAFSYYLRTGRLLSIPHLETHIDPCFYIWRTQKDHKVRSEHLENEGKIFDRRFPPPTGNPGESFNCRCWADNRIPVGIEIFRRNK